MHYCFLAKAVDPIYTNMAHFRLFSSERKKNHMNGDLTEVDSVHVYTLGLIHCTSTTSFKRDSEFLSIFTETIIAFLSGNTEHEILYVKFYILLIQQINAPASPNCLLF